MTCPYCGTQQPTYAFRSPAQLAYINHYVDTLNDALASLTADGEVVIDMDEIVESAIPRLRTQSGIDCSTTRTKSILQEILNESRGKREAKP